jgi:protein translocase SecG subunit
MSILESIWFFVASLIILIILLVNPKTSLTGSNANTVLGLFSSPSSGQQFIYNFSAVLILGFFVLTTFLSYID